MTLHLYDTATRQTREFTPLQPGVVGVYLCGATVQAPPHIGHIRSGVAFEVLWRWLEVGHGYDVTFIRNVTDIDDKILSKSAEAGVPWWAWAYRHELAFSQAYDALGVRRPTYEPRATGHVPEMVELIERLLERGHAYVAEDSSGDVYFDIRSFSSYGELTHQKPDDMSPAEDANPRGKRDPRDFALWKGWKPGEPESASWPTPYGRGRPGWHLECSAMAYRYLGAEFDIHAGGVDLRFPHHENEQAQSRAAGYGFAQHWLHNGWVTIGGEKMSKSLGNSLLVENMLHDVRPLVLRYYLGQSHYRSTVEYSPDALVEAEAAVNRIEGFLKRAGAAGGDETSSVPTAFREAMDDDLNVAAGLAVVHDTVRIGNTALDSGDGGRVAEAARDVVAMTNILGINPIDPKWRAGAASGPPPELVALDALVRNQLDRRDQARVSRDFATADEVRDQLRAAGILVEDTPSGARWTLDGGSA